MSGSFYNPSTINSGVNFTYLNSLDISGITTTATDLCIANNNIFVIQNNRNVHQYTLDNSNVANSIFVRTNTGDIGGTGFTSNFHGIDISGDGARLFMCRGANNTIGQSDISAYNISSYSNNYNVAGIASQNNSSYAIRFNNDGTKVFCGYSTGNTIREIACSVAFDFNLGNETLTTGISPSFVGTTISGLSFNSDGTKLFVSTSTDKFIYILNLASPYTLSGYSLSQIVLYSDLASSIVGIYWYSNKLYVLSPSAIYAYSVNI